jgi:hypothetical protein
MDESAKAPADIEAPPAAASHVRMRHADSTISFSFAEKQDDGAWVVPMDQLDHAQAHGLYICHTDDESAPAQSPEVPAAPATEAKAGEAEAEAVDETEDEPGEKQERRRPGKKS